VKILIPFSDLKFDRRKPPKRSADRVDQIFQFGKITRRVFGSLQTGFFRPA
jgi:hypothetical protein